ncbi:hypothetical protein L1987_51956 [Smallanthus sonchifolius]|uniref:Uncharacterized protein n=1 Tax=Smallanthus sonchifolius TaxID=185202 RepID=A0ACB9ESI0_9ASTR|nr:hypothetical protein L1987_51956 [Smallanthus sonchifolius]
MDVSFYATVVVDAEVTTKQLKALPYDTPGQTFVVFVKPERVPAVGRFSNMWKFIVNEVPNLYKNKMQASAEMYKKQLFNEGLHRLHSTRYENIGSMLIRYSYHSHFHFHSTILLNPYPYLSHASNLSCCAYGSVIAWTSLRIVVDMSAAKGESLGKACDKIRLENVKIDFEVKSF